MMVFVLLAAAAAQPVEVRAGAVAQATATIRILPGKRLTLGQSTPEAQLRQSVLRDVDGRSRQAQLIEFQ